MNEALQELESVVGWIAEQTESMVLPFDRRGRLALGCLDLAIEHQAGLAHLAGLPLWGSVYALLRCMIDAFVRGVWLARCASETDLDSFELAGLRGRSFDELVGEVDRALGHSRGILSKLAHSSWAMFSDFTQTAAEPVRRKYPVTETDQALRLATALGLLAATELADLSGRRDVALACKARAASPRVQRH